MNQESRKAGNSFRKIDRGICARALTAEALAVEFALSGLQFVRQYPVPLFYRDHQIGKHRLDFLVEGKIVVELKAVSRLEDIHFAIGRSYLKAISLEDGLLFNFATTPLTIKRFCRERTKSASPDLLA